MQPTCSSQLHLQGTKHQSSFSKVKAFKNKSVDGSWGRLLGRGVAPFKQVTRWLPLAQSFLSASAGSLLRNWENFLSPFYINAIKAVFK